MSKRKLSALGFLWRGRCNLFTLRYIMVFYIFTSETCITFRSGPYNLFVLVKNQLSKTFIRIGSPVCPLRNKLTNTFIIKARLGVESPLSHLTSQERPHKSKVGIFVINLTHYRDCFVGRWKRFAIATLFITFSADLKAVINNFKYLPKFTMK